MSVNDAAAISVVIADDQALLRGALRVMIGNMPGFTVLAEAADGAEAVAAARSNRPDVVLMDIRMPGTDGVAATRAITGDPGCAGVKVLILTTFDLDELVYAALRAGASGFLLKDVPPEDLLAAIRVIAAGDALIAPSVTRRLIAEFARLQPASPATPAAAALSLITEREREVLALVARGLSNTEIAQALTISHATVKTYISRLLAKLAARDRAQLVMIAYETRLVAPA
jgi:DNA-binding NarL/FixJ family response regulator